MAQLWSYIVATMGLLLIFGAWLIGNEIMTMFTNWAVTGATVNSDYYGFYVTLFAYLGVIAFFSYVTYLLVNAQRARQNYI